MNYMFDPALETTTTAEGKEILQLGYIADHNSPADGGGSSHQTHPDHYEKRWSYSKMKNGFCESKFKSMLISGTFTKAVMYLMLLSDSIIAGYFVGSSGVAGINAITPVTAIVTFFGDLLSTGVGIAFTREI